MPRPPTSSPPAYGGQSLTFGPDYLIPRPFDPRLIVRDRAGGRQGGDGERAWRRGRSPISTPIATSLSQFVFRSGLLMKPIFDRGPAPIRGALVFAEGEDERVLRAVQTVVDERPGQADPGRAGRRS